MRDGVLTRALSALQSAGMNLADTLNPARELDCLRVPGIARKTLARLREYAHEQGLRAPRGGAGRGQGRKAEDGATGLVQIAVRVTVPQREKLVRLGGSVWIRKAIDDAL